MEVKYNSNNDRKYMNGLPNQEDPMISPNVANNMKVKKQQSQEIVESATGGELEYITE